MDKKLLKKLPLISIKKEWISLAERLNDSDINYLVAAEKATVNKKDTLVIYFFHKTSMDKARYRVFLDKEDYITQDFSSESMKWKTGTLYRLLDIYNWHKKCVLVDDKTSRVLKEFLGTEKETLYALEKLQDVIQAQRLTKKHQVIKDRIDKKMKNVPKLPKNFEQWVNDSVLYHSRYIYYLYTRNKKSLQGYCTHCQMNVKVEGAKHNTQGVCPNCKSSVTYKSIGRAGRIIDYGKAAIIQKVGDDLLVRNFNVIKYYKADYKNPIIEYDELQRHFVDKDGVIDSYEYSYFKQTSTLRWCEGIRNNSSYSMFYSKAYDFYETVLYTRNLSKVLKNSILKYSGLKEFALYNNVTEFPLISYINNYLSHPWLEYLVKLKLYTLVDDILYRNFSSNYGVSDFNINGKNMYEILGVNKVGLKTLQRINGGYKVLRIIKEAEKANLKLTDDQILFIAKHTNIQNVIKASKYTTVHKMLKYVTSQSSGKLNINNAFNDWLDYIAYCKILKYDLESNFVLFPRHLTKSHDELSSLIKDNKLEIYNARIAEMFEILNKQFSWQSKEYTVLVPKSYDAIVSEGNSLNHCVGKGSYGEKIVKGESVILFLRNKEDIDKPFYTVELDTYSNEIRQCRGKDNQAMNDKVKKTMDRFEKEVLGQMYYGKAV